MYTKIDKGKYNMSKTYMQEKDLLDWLKTLDFDKNKAMPQEILDIFTIKIADISKLRPNFTYENPLTPRELQCLILLSCGKTVPQCADLLGISEKTVYKNEENFRKSLGAKDRTHAFYLAIINDFITIAPK